VSAFVRSARDRRVLVLGVVSILLILGLGRGLPAWRSWRAETHASARELTSEVTRARESISRHGLVNDSLSARRGRFVALAPLLLRGETPAMGGASLASLVASAATAANVRLGPVQVQPDTTARTVFSRVRVRADVTGDVRGVGTFISSLERGQTLLAIREISISQLEPGAPPERAEALRVNLTVEGLMLTPRPAKGHEVKATSGHAGGAR
jgi:hypothetical protein